jgi:hypothetical protein
VPASGDKKRTNWMKIVRNVHLYSGVTLSLALLVVALTGVYLVHKDDLPWARRVMISGRFLPRFYAGDMKARRTAVAALAPNANGEIWAGTGQGVWVLSDGGCASAPVQIGEPVQWLHHLGPGRLLLGTRTALYRYDADRQEARRVLTADEPYDVAVAPSGRLWLTLHRTGARFSDDGGLSWQSPARPLEAETGDLHAHGLTVLADEHGETVLVGTADGIYAGGNGAAGWSRRAMSGQYVKTIRRTPAGDGRWCLLAITKRHQGRGEDALWQSLDAGWSWTRVRLPIGETVPAAGQPDRAPPIESLAVSDTGAAAVLMKSGVAYRSDPAGEWRLIQPRRDDSGPAGRVELAGQAMTALPPPKESFKSLALIERRIILGDEEGRVTVLEADGSERTLRVSPGSKEAGGVTLDKLLNDLHTGAFFGKKLWVAYDALGAGLVLFVVSGLFLWLYPKWRSRRRGAATL